MQSSPFLRLPAELRNEIYSYVLTKGTYHFRFQYLKRTTSASEKKNRLSLLLSYRQIHAKAALLISSLNTFHFHNVIIFKQAIASLSDGQRKVIRNIAIDVQVGLDERNSTIAYINENTQEGTSITDMFPNLETVFITNQDRYGDRVQNTEVGMRLQRAKQLLKEWMAGGSGGKVKLQYRDTESRGLQDMFG